MFSWAGQQIRCQQALIFSDCIPQRQQVRYQQASWLSCLVAWTEICKRLGKPAGDRPAGFYCKPETQTQWLTSRLLHRSKLFPRSKEQGWHQQVFHQQVDASLWVFQPKDMSMSCAPACARGLASQATAPRVTIHSRAAQRNQIFLVPTTLKMHHLCSSKCAAAAEAVATLYASFKRTCSCMLGYQATDPWPHCGVQGACKSVAGTRMCPSHRHMCSHSRRRRWHQQVFDQQVDASLKSTCSSKLCSQSNATARLELTRRCQQRALEAHLQRSHKHIRGST